jgi:hypothetical protein
VSEIETENQNLNSSLNEVNISLKNLKSEEDGYAKYSGLIISLKNEVKNFPIGKF